ncbi:mitochondrial inner membrane m-AAA protease component paraplegin-like isoform X2 [Dysidea avara]
MVTPRQVAKQRLLRSVMLASYRNYSSNDKRDDSAEGSQSSSNDSDRNNQNKPEDEVTLAQVMAGLTVLAVCYLAANSEQARGMPEVSLSYFLQHMLYTGEVEKLGVNKEKTHVYVYLHPGAVINGRKVRQTGPHFVFTISSVDSLELKLEEVQNEMGIDQSSRIPIMYMHEEPSHFMSDVVKVSIVAAGLVLVIGYFISRNVGKGGRFEIRIDLRDKSRPRASFGTTSDLFDVDMGTNTPNDSTITFKDIAGMEEAKQEVYEFVDYLKSQQKYAALGARIPKGVLLYGPPGTGKTLLAKALANEAKVPFLYKAGPEFEEQYAGLGASRVRRLFNSARKMSPAIIYIDELDAIGSKRKSGHSEDSATEQTLNQLLVEMDGINPLDGVVIMASTNREDVLDQALLRPGRFDRQIPIELPVLPERKSIFELYLKKLPLEHPPEQYVSRLAALTPGHTGADIANICNEAALRAAREKGKVISGKHFDMAIERVIAGMEKPGSLNAKEKEVVAFHEAGHALVGWLLEHTDPVLKVSIVPRSKGALGFAQYLPSDQKLYTTEQLFDRICMALGGRAAEAIVFRRISTGAEDDLRRVTEMAQRQVAEYGMSPSIGHISVQLPRTGQFEVRPYSDHLTRLIDQETRRIINEAYKRVEKLLTVNRSKLNKLAESLQEKDRLSYQDIVDLIGPMKYEKHLHHAEFASDM